MLPARIITSWLQSVLSGMLFIALVSIFYRISTETSEWHQVLPDIFTPTVLITIAALICSLPYMVLMCLLLAPSNGQQETLKTRITLVLVVHYLLSAASFGIMHAVGVDLSRFPEAFLVIIYPQTGAFFLVYNLIKDSRKARNQHVPTATNH